MDVEAVAEVAPEQLSRDAGLMNYSGLSDSAIAGDPQVRHLMKQLSAWGEEVRGRSLRNASMFDRSAFVPPNNPYDEMQAARRAVDEDDIVSGVADITEAFALQGMRFESIEPDEADVFNQWAADIDMDSVLRRIWREEYTLSQVVIALQWDWREYRVRGRLQSTSSDQPADTAPGDQPAEKAAIKRRKRRKSYRLWVPTKITILDSSKIVPIGNSPLTEQRLAWIATPEEGRYYSDVLAGRIVDMDVSAFYGGIYDPSPAERLRLGRLGVPYDSFLIMLNPEKVFRYTTTKSDYQAYAPLRMKSLFPILDLKRQLIAADRAALVGAANYILLITKGTDNLPAQPEEIDNLKGGYNYLAKMPVIISDHRLNIEIITPKTDMTLDGAKYETLDIRLLMRLLGTLSLGARGQRNETNVTLSHAVARMMENRRHMIKRAVEREIVRAIIEHPNNKSQQLQEEPNLVFVPRNIALGIDAALIQALLGLRTSREISRETILEEFGLDQATEAIRMEYEAEVYDDIFKTQIPFSAAPGDPSAGDHPADAGSPQANGAKGGRPTGGGAPNRNATTAKPKSGNGNTSTGGK